MPDWKYTPERVESALEEAGYDGLLVEETGDVLTVTGLVRGEGDRDAILDVVRQWAPGYRVDDNLTIAGALPEETLEASSLSEVEVGGFRGAEAGLSQSESINPGDFTDHRTAASPLNVQPASLSRTGQTLADDDDAVNEGDLVYTPPTDPVGTDREVIGGFSSSSMDSLEVARSSDGTLGDEAIADAIRRELREDAATTSLRLEVSVTNGIVHLHGEVDDIIDVESAEEVAARVPGVASVVEELRIRRDGSR